MKSHHRLILATATHLVFAPWSRAVQESVYSASGDAPPVGHWQNFSWMAAAALVALALVWKLSADSRAAALEARVRIDD